MTMRSRHREEKSSDNLTTLRFAASGILDERKVQWATKNELAPLIAHFGLGTEWGVLSIPLGWRPGGLRPSNARCNLYSAFAKVARSKEELELAVLVASRMFMCLMVLPGQSRKNAGVFLKPMTIMARLRGIWLPIIKLALSRPTNDEQKLLGRIRPQDVTGTESMVKRSVAELARFHILSSQNYWNDSYKNFGANPSGEPSNLGSTENEGLSVDRRYQPLPDVFVHRAGYSSAWILNNLSDYVLDVFEELVTHRGCRISRQRKSQPLEAAPLTRHTKEFMRSYEWRKIQIPFSIHFQLSTHAGFAGVNGRKSSCFAWPPKNWVQLLFLVELIQMAHYFIIALSTGARISELLSFTIHSLVESRDGMTNVNGRTWKIVRHFDGEERDWPLPELAVRALIFQIRLSKLLNIFKDPTISEEQFSSRPFSLWLTISTIKKVVANPLRSNTANGSLKKYAEVLGLDHLLDDIPLTNHRFRKTIARLIAITFVHSAEILQDIFGHRTIDMTLAYILSSPQILADMRDARKELVIIMARDAIAQADDLGGPAAKNIKQAVATIRQRKMSDYHVSDEDALAFVLTSGGRTWTKPRESVICTKGRGEVSLCSAGTKQIDASNCQVNCWHRLELPAGKQQAEQAATRCVEKMAQLIAADKLLEAEVWGIRLLENLSRFEEIRQRWIGHPMVMYAMNSKMAERGL
ncbi:tyrosine-type recombinase/integrase [uncultured Herbaspirillum sp.]|uniref:tyrosine-type recombinase/integrase n=1 Tax=uncultured Herbaspirillum sp. TaxID=160236 RepID=UPI00258894A0|nr:tyrosine-type recombinase/integrase [uncultured Herbaspirillum sp.]